MKQIVEFFQGPRLPPKAADYLIAVSWSGFGAGRQYKVMEAFFNGRTFASEDLMQFSRSKLGFSIDAWAHLPGHPAIPDYRSAEFE